MISFDWLIRQLRKWTKNSCVLPTGSDQQTTWLDWFPDLIIIILSEKELTVLCGPLKTVQKPGLYMLSYQYSLTYLAISGNQSSFACMVREDMDINLLTCAELLIRWSVPVYVCKKDRQSCQLWYFSFNFENRKKKASSMIVHILSQRIYFDDLVHPIWESILAFYFKELK